MLTKKIFKIGELVKSKIHKNGLTTWRILDIYKNTFGNKIYVFCEAAHDTKKQYGFDSIKYEFKLNDIEEF